MIGRKMYPGPHQLKKLYKCLIDYDLDTALWRGFVAKELAKYEAGDFYREWFVRVSGYFMVVVAHPPVMLACVPTRSAPCRISRVGKCRKRIAGKRTPLVKKMRGVWRQEKKKRSSRKWLPSSSEINDPENPVSLRVDTIR